MSRRFKYLFPAGLLRTGPTARTARYAVLWNGDGQCQAAEELDNWMAGPSLQVRVRVLGTPCWLRPPSEGFAEAKWGNSNYHGHTFVTLNKGHWKLKLLFWFISIPGVILIHWNGFCTGKMRGGGGVGSHSPQCRTRKPVRVLRPSWTEKALISENKSFPRKECFLNLNY